MAKQNKPDLHSCKQIVKAKLFIDKNYRDTIHIDIIALEACLSKFHFLRLFKRAYGITPHQYVNRLRIEKARNLLQRGVTISDTCYHLGFSSLSSFNKLFKQHLKVAPSVYALRAKNKNDKIAIMPFDHIPDSYIFYLGWNKQQL